LILSYIVKYENKKLFFHSFFQLLLAAPPGYVQPPPNSRSIDIVGATPGATNPGVQAVEPIYTKPLER